jgi:HK97 family phage major capsid protein/HK97 family phage prohead protease
MREVRFYHVSAVRESGDGKRITGYAAVFNQLSEDLGGFRELVLPGAFSRCLGSSPDVRCLFNHDRNVVLGRTKAGTLRLSADANGLRFDCDLPDTQAGRDLRESIGRRDIDQCSFAFNAVGEKWREQSGADGKPETVRELTDVELFDVSPVTYAAYPQTSVSARLLWPEGEPSEVRSHKKADGPRAPKPRTLGVPVFRVSPPATPLAELDHDKLLDHINQKLGSSGSNLEESGMRQIRTMGAVEQTELRRFLLTGRHEQRGLTAGGDAAAFVPESFNAQVWDALKAYDAIFSDAVCTHIESDTGGPLDLFAVDDTTSAATILAEEAASDEQDPGLGKTLLAQAPTWDSGIVKVSWATLQDSRVDFASFLSETFAIRFARGIGPSLITTLLAAAKLGATATGAAKNTGGSETGANSIGTADLVTLRTSVNPGYRAAGAWWLMNDNTLGSLDSLLDKQGRPVIKQIYVNGQRILMGYPVGICPSLPDIGSAAKPILFGATSYFVLRIVKGEGRLVRMAERYAEKLQTGFKSFLRANAALLCAEGADSPVKYLQNAA